MQLNSTSVRDARQESPQPFYNLDDTQLRQWDKSVPSALRELPQWVVWKYRYNPHKRQPWEKAPFTPVSDKAASSTDSRTWSEFDAAVAWSVNGYDGIGFVLRGNDGIVGIDLDKCRNRTSGEIEAWASDIINLFRSYTEISPSGTGIRIFVRGSLPAGKRKKGDLEIYDSKRYLTISGHPLEGCRELQDCPDETLQKWYAATFGQAPQRPVQSPPRPSLTMSDETIISVILRAKNAAKFQSLMAGSTSGYPSHSEAEAALMGMLVFYTTDPEQLERFYSNSGLYRDKWYEPRGNSTVGKLTTDTAIRNRTGAYNSRYSSDATSTSKQKPDGVPKRGQSRAYRVQRKPRKPRERTVRHEQRRHEQIEEILRFVRASSGKVRFGDILAATKRPRTALRHDIAELQQFGRIELFGECYRIPEQSPLDLSE